MELGSSLAERQGLEEMGSQPIDSQAGAPQKLSRPSEEDPLRGVGGRMPGTYPLPDSLLCFIC